MSEQDAAAPPKRYLVAPRFALNCSIEITAGEYDKILKGTEALIHAVDIEEKFNSIIQNYADIEQRIFNESFRALMGDRFEDVSAHGFRTDLARLLLNFLASVRLYQESICRHAGGISVEDLWPRIKAQMEHEFDSNLNYRVMDGLRNYGQHQALPVHGYAIDSSWDAAGDFLNFEMRPYIRVVDLAKSPKFRRKTLDELKAGPDQIELKPMIRSYVESLISLHGKFRTMTGGSLWSHHQNILLVRKKMKDETHLDPLPQQLLAYESDAAGTQISEGINILEDLDDYVRFLQGRSGNLQNFAKRRVRY